VNKSILKHLIIIANSLDKRGLYAEANRIDFAIKLATSPDDERVEGTTLTFQQFNDIMKRYTDDVEVQISGNPPDETVVLKFTDGGPDVTITGDEWDAIQVSLGIM